MITIMEIMGRNAGWLTGATALARTEDCDGPDLIYLPEFRLILISFLPKSKISLRKNLPWLLLFQRESALLTVVIYANSEARVIT